MNFFENIPNTNPPQQINGINPPFMINNDLNYKINELELRIKRLEQRMSILENNNPNNNYTEQDNSLYMI